MFMERTTWSGHPGRVYDRKTEDPRSFQPQAPMLCSLLPLEVCSRAHLHPCPILGAGLHVGGAVNFFLIGANDNGH